MLGQILGAVVGAGLNAGFGAIQNEWAAGRTAEDRRENYRYGEMAANEADKRTRALYSDIYSPGALVEQYKKAGLSPSMMAGGMPGGGGMSGAHGTGAAGMQTPYMPMSLLEGAQISNLVAQAEKTKAETQNIRKDTDLKGLEEQWNTWRNNERSVEFEILQQRMFREDGSSNSLFEEATECDDYNEFLNKVRKAAENNNNERIKQITETEFGQKELRKIYMSANRFDRDIKVLSEEGVNADFQQSVLKCMNREGFANQNAQTAIEQLKAAAETSKLTVQQAGAWNDILERMGRKNETAKDILIVLSMIFNQAASKWNFVK